MRMGMRREGWLRGEEGRRRRRRRRRWTWGKGRIVGAGVAGLAVGLGWVLGGGGGGWWWWKGGGGGKWEGEEGGTGGDGDGEDEGAGEYRHGADDVCEFPKYWDDDEFGVVDGGGVVDAWPGGEAIYLCCLAVGVGVYSYLLRHLLARWGVVGGGGGGVRELPHDDDDDEDRHSTTTTTVLLSSYHVPPPPRLTTGDDDDDDDDDGREEFPNGELDDVPVRYVVGCEGDRVEARRRWRKTLRWRRDEKVSVVCVFFFFFFFFL